MANDDAPEDKSLAPRRPDLLPETTFGGRWRKRVFARLVWQGMDPYQAFIKADYPVIGVTAPIGAEPGFTPEAAARQAQKMAGEPWCKEWGLAWSLDHKEQVKVAVPEAIALLIEGLSHKGKNGQISALAVRCAENLLDRGGIVRSQVVEKNVTDEGVLRQDAKELVRIIKERLESLETAVPKPKAMDGIIDIKKIGGGRG